MIEEFDRLYETVIKETVGSYNPCYGGSQMKEEFIEAWNVLIEYVDQNIDSKDTLKFLEIGAYKGLWPLMLSFVCSHLDKKFEYTTITWLNQDPNNHSLLRVKDYYNNNDFKFSLINKNSQDPSNLKDLEPNYNIVFIDADHRYEGVIKDHCCPVNF